MGVLRIDNKTFQPFFQDCGQIHFGLSYLPTAQRLSFNIAKVVSLSSTIVIIVIIVLVLVVIILATVLVLIDAIIVFITKEE